MKRMPWISFSFGVLAVALVAQGCGSSGSTTGGGTGGGTASGSGGSSSGSGGSGSPGSGGSTGGGGAGTDPSTLPLCASGVKDKTACMSTDVPCANTCGPNSLGLKACTCGTVTTGMWDCPACVFVTGAGHDYTCYKLPAAPAMCPAGATAGTLLKTNDPCTGSACDPTAPTTSNVCGSAAAGVTSYMDSSGTAKTGFCACIVTAMGNQWKCASSKEWPTM